MNLDRLALRASSLTMCFSAACATAPALAANSHEVAATLNASGDTLSLTIKETQEVTSSCDSYVSSFAYLPSLGALTVQVKPNLPCQLDRLGRNETSLSFRLPTKVRAQKRLCLVVNDQNLGLIELKDGQAVLNSGSCQ